MAADKEKIIKLIKEYEFSEEELCRIHQYIIRLGEFRKKFLQPKQDTRP